MKEIWRNNKKNPKWGFIKEIIIENDPEVEAPVWTYSRKRGLFFIGYNYFSWDL